MIVLFIWKAMTIRTNSTQLILRSVVHHPFPAVYAILPLVNQYWKGSIIMVHSDCAQSSHEYQES